MFQTKRIDVTRWGATCLLGLLLSALSACDAPVTRESGNTARKAGRGDQGGWRVSIGKRSGQFAIVRQKDFPDGFPKASYSTRLSIVWECRETRGKGLPSRRESELLAKFEATFVKAMEGDGDAVLSMIVTSGGTREFVLHSKDADRSLARWKALRDASGAYPIRVSHGEDPSWHYEAAILAK